MNEEKMQQLLVKKKTIKKHFKKKLSKVDIKFLPEIKKHLLSTDEEIRSYAILRLQSMLNSKEDAMANLIVLSLLITPESEAYHITDNCFWEIEKHEQPQKTSPFAKISIFNTNIHEAPKIEHLHLLVNINEMFIDICTYIKSVDVKSNTHFIYLAQKFIEEYSIISSSCIWIDWTLAQNASEGCTTPKLCK